VCRTEASHHIPGHARCWRRFPSRNLQCPGWLLSLSVVALRSALEVTTIGAWAQVYAKRKEFRSWRSGKSPLSFGQACDGLCGCTATLRDRLRTTANDSLFDQRNSSDEGGFARRIFGGVSNYTHSRPGHADSDMRESNGPIYVKSAFNHVTWMQFEVMGLCLVVLLIPPQTTSACAGSRRHRPPDCDPCSRNRRSRTGCRGGRLGSSCGLSAWS
jgi:hypothetical protein